MTATTGQPDRAKAAKDSRAAPMNPVCTDWRTGRPCIQRSMSGVMNSSPLEIDSMVPPNWSLRPALTAKMGR